MLFWAQLPASYDCLKKLSVDHRIPFGPFLGAGIWIAVLAGKAIVNFYIGFMDSLVIKHFFRYLTLPQVQSQNLLRGESSDFNHSRTYNSPPATKKTGSRK